MGLGRRYADTCGHGAGEEVCRYMWTWGWGGGMKIHVGIELGRGYMGQWAWQGAHEGVTKHSHIT